MFVCLSVCACVCLSTSEVCLCVQTMFVCVCVCVHLRGVLVCADHVHVRVCVCVVVGAYMSTSLTVISLVNKNR